MTDPLDILPAHRRLAAEAVLANAFPGEAALALTPMTGGASGARLYRTRIAGRDVVLRLDRPSDGFSDPSRHYHCQAIAAEAGVAPALLHADAQTQISLSAFVEGQPAHGQLAAVIAAVRRLHDAPRFPTVVPYLTGMQTVLTYLDATHAMPAAAMDAARALLDRVGAAYRHEEADLVASHNDLNPGNILFDGERAVIVDWATAFAADRYVDLSAVLNFFAHDAATEAMALEAYFGRPPRALEQAKVRVMRQVNRLFYGSILIATAAMADPEMRLTAADLETEPFAKVRQSLPPMTTPHGQSFLGRVFFSDAMRGAAEPAFAAALETVRA